MRKGGNILSVYLEIKWILSQVTSFPRFSCSTSMHRVLGSCTVCWYNLYDARVGCARQVVCVYKWRCWFEDCLCQFSRYICFESCLEKYGTTVRYCPIRVNRTLFHEE